MCVFIYYPVAIKKNLYLSYFIEWLLSVCIDITLEEESAILSKRKVSRQKFNKGPEVDNRATSNHGNVNKESGRGFGFANRESYKGTARPGRGTGADGRRGAGITTHVVIKTADTGIICKKGNSNSETE